MTKAALRIHPRDSPILDAKVTSVIMSCGISKKISLDIGHAHETISGDMLKSIRDGWITERWRVRTRVEASSSVVRGNTNLDFGKTGGHEKIRWFGKRCLINNVNVCDGSCSISI